jgi:hypothetical protein
VFYLKQKTVLVFESLKSYSKVNVSLCRWMIFPNFLRFSRWWQSKTCPELTSGKICPKDPGNYPAKDAAAYSKGMQIVTGATWRVDLAAETTPVKLEANFPLFYCRNRYAAFSTEANDFLF